MKHEDFLRMRLCTGKVRHSTRDAAIREAERLSTTKKKSPSVEFHAYRCCFCRHYHVGKSIESESFEEWILIDPQ
jgi:hypothetical protein